MEENQPQPQLQGFHGRAAQSLAEQSSGRRLYSVGESSSASTAQHEEDEEEFDQPSTYPKPRPDKDKLVVPKFCYSFGSGCTDTEDALPWDEGSMQRRDKIAKSEIDRNYSLSHTNSGDSQRLAMEMLVHNVQGGTFSDTNNDPSEESFSMKRPPPNLTNLQVVRTTSSPECGDDYPESSTSTVQHVDFTESGW
eukprot:CAMPEP_0184327080 /NCGR_PEP_ID=MMETSP1049-20130417/142905_1 /TAXON_ID=77928 /ORGANISM="Proteomonas sulcata, Strain CCMP704" /LENGTH=193 /DNA_ID=CAMNT_0026649315 /DNA_START=685 /DNA_END=1263 /DNA_ORIENTATION=-